MVLTTKRICCRIWEHLGYYTNYFPRHSEYCWVWGIIQQFSFCFHWGVVKYALQKSSLSNLFSWKNKDLALYVLDCHRTTATITVKLKLNTNKISMFFTPFKYIDYTNYKYYILTSNFHEWPRENSFLQYQ